MMGFFSNLFAKQNCAVCGKECGTLHRSKLRDGVPLRRLRQQVLQIHPAQ